ncbi:MAG: LPP20 family lipoprotein [Bacteroidales bacterium]|nr:LPP20 family lipoprotein [Candidatus Liminaster caballi]
MRLQRIYLILLFMICPILAFSQGWDEIRNGSSYLYGEGWGSTVNEADQEALRDLISKISVSVSADFSTIDKETFADGKLDVSSMASYVVNTYSQATLNNTVKIILNNEPDAHVARWVRKSEINRIFESRKEKVNDLIQAGLKAEEEGKVDFALKDYYWALTLLKSLQYPNEVKYVAPEDGVERMLINWIPERMNKVFNDVSISVSGQEGEDVDLQILYRGKPVNSIDYSFWDGRDWSNIYSAKDGRGVIELASGNQSDIYKFKIEYEYREQHTDPEVEGVLKIFKSVSLRASYKDVKSGVNAAAVAPTLTASTAGYVSNNSFSKIPSSAYEMPKQLPDASKYEPVVSKVISAIKAKAYDSVRELFTDNGFDVYSKLIKYGTARVLDTPVLSFFKHGDEIICRGATMSFSFASGMRKSFVEDVVFTLTESGKITNISFGLGQTANDDILGKGQWSDQVRLAIMQFLENYKTAFALKRIDYIETLFDDNAVIITKSVAQRTNRKVNDFGNLELAQKIIRENRFDKRSYIRYLRQSFASKEFINIRFADNDVRNLGGDVYCLQINQEYYSSNYGDQGYLFLMIDISDPNQPLIKVRTWQPDKDPNFGLYGPEHFN